MTALYNPLANRKVLLYNFIHNMDTIFDKLTKKKEDLDRLKPFSEGNTLTREETAEVLKKFKLIQKRLQL